MKINRELSQKVDKAIGAIHAAFMGQCYRNAWLALTTLPELAEGYYVEGWAVSSEDPSRVPGPHGWIELNNEIIDPTLYQRTDLVYFTGSRFTKEEAIEAIPEAFRREPELRLPIWEHSTWKSPEFAQAEEKALRYLTILEKRLGL